MKWIIAVLICIAVAGGIFFWYTPAKSPDAIPNDLIRVDMPAANSIVTSPLSITGAARGRWYFEASFPITLLDANRVEIVQSHAEAQSNWMTEDFVPFIATIEFAAPATDTGFLVLHKDNPSGLPEHDASVEIPVRFK